jgi:hypothetical protein
MQEVEYIPVTVVSFLRDEGTLVLFRALTEDEGEGTVSLLPGYAADVMALLVRGERPEIAVPEYLIVPWAS